MNYPFLVDNICREYIYLLRSRSIIEWGSDLCEVWNWHQEIYGWAARTKTPRKANTDLGIRV